MTKVNYPQQLIHSFGEAVEEARRSTQEVQYIYELSENSFEICSRYDDPASILATYTKSPFAKVMYQEGGVYIVYTRNPKAKYGDRDEWAVSWVLRPGE